MRNSRTGLVMAALLGASCAGCASMSVPARWLQKPADTQAAVTAGWAEARLASPRGASVRGELIAVSRDSIYIANTSFHAIPRDSVRSVWVGWYDASEAAVVGTVFLGTLVTISNGVWLVFTAPMWLIGGVIAGTAHLHDAIASYPEQGWMNLARFARFPQGLPPAIDRGRITMWPPILTSSGDSYRTGR